MRKQNTAEAVSFNHPRRLLEKSMEFHVEIISELHAVLLMHMVHSSPPSVNIILEGQIQLTSH